MKSLFKKGMIAAVAVMALMVSATSVVSAYNQAEYTANGKPQFNTYTSVDNFGNEKDFFRVGPVGGKGSQFTNNFDACSGEAQFNTYVHNGAPEGYNGANNTGTGVAKNTKLQIKLPTGSGKVQNAEAVISAKDVATVSDGATIKCGDHDVKVEYVTDSATIYSIARGQQKLSNAVVNGGTLIGTYADDGVVPGCWDQRIYVTIKVKITKVTPPPAKSVGECKVLDVAVLGDRKVRASVTGVTENATIVGYEINFGDGTKVNQQTAEHTYAKDGTYKVVSRVQVKYADGKVEWKTASNCAKEITFKPGVPPTPTPVTPTTPGVLPNTGAGDIIGIFAAVTIAGAVAHRYILSRRFL